MDWIANMNWAEIMDRIANVNWVVIFICGMAVGWLLDWVVDFIYWHKRFNGLDKEKCTLADSLENSEQALAAAQNDLTEREKEIRSLQNRLAEEHARVAELQRQLNDIDPEADDIASMAMPLAADAGMSLSQIGEATGESGALQSSPTVSWWKKPFIWIWGFLMGIINGLDVIGGWIIAGIGRLWRLVAGISSKRSRA